MQKPKYKLVCTEAAYDRQVGEIIAVSDDVPYRPGGHGGWMMDDGQAEWQEVVKSAEEMQAKIKANMTNFVQSILDTEAQKRNYDNIVSATSYAGYANQFQAEGIAFGVWRSAVWAKCYEIMADVLSDKRQVPTEEQLIAELPKLTI